MDDKIQMTTEERKAMREMLEESQLYMQSGLTMEDVDRYNTTFKPGQENQAFFKMFRESMKEMMMSHHDYADELSDVYRDIYNEANQERQKLDAEADISGWEKVKHDTLGTRKRAAKKRRDVLNARDTNLAQTRADRIQRDKQARTDAADAEIFGDAQVWRNAAYSIVAEYQEVEQNYADLYQNVPFDEFTPADKLVTKRFRKTENFIEMAQINDSLSPYNVAVELNQRQFANEDEVGKTLPNVPVYKKPALWYAALGRADTISCDDMFAIANRAYILNYGSDLGYNIATDEEKEEAYDFCEAAVRRAYDEIHEFQTEHTAILSGNCMPSVYLREYYAVSGLERKLFAVNDLIRVMTTSHYYAQVSDYKKANMKEYARYIEIMEDYCLALLRQATSWGRYASGHIKYTVFDDIPPLQQVLTDTTDFVRGED